MVLKKSEIIIRRFSHEKIKLFFVLAIPCALVSCANIVSPTGGPKDVTPPEVIETIPLNGTANFTGNRFILRFDEFVRLNNIQQQILISPPLDHNPEFRLRGKRLIVSFNDTLIENTTYSFHFGDAIGDITENNRLVNYAYYFSTGDYIDSLTLHGTVKNAKDQKVEENIFVLLHELPLKDSAIAKYRPRYVTRADKNGRFRFDHIADNKYHIVAIVDKNNNLLYDDINEPIAFHDKMVKPYYDKSLFADTIPTDTIKNDSLITKPHISIKESIDLLMFVAEDSIQRVITARSLSKQKAVIALRYPVKDADIVIKDTSLYNNYVLQWNDNDDTLTIWFKPHSIDTISLTISDIDFTDTLKIYMRDPIVSRARHQVPVVEISTNVKRGSKLHPSITPELQFNKPLYYFNKESALFISPEDTVPLITKPVDTVLRMRHYVKNRTVPGNNYSVIIPANSCKAWDDATNDSTYLSFNIDVRENYGSLNVEINIDTIYYKGDILISLIDERTNIFETQRFEPGTKLSFEPLKPGSYSLKAIHDSNGNGRWDTGDYWKGIQPEKVYLLPDKINIRENWTEEIVWSLDL